MTEPAHRPPTEPAEPARRPRDPAGRRQAIIDAAIDVIAEGGLADLTHRRVATAADVPVGSTTYYFKDLDELREAALAHAAQGSLDGLDQWTQALAESDDVADTLATLTAEYLAERDHYRALNGLYAAAGHRPELRPLARVWSDGLQRVLEPHTGPQASEAIATFIDGAVWRALVIDEPISAASLRRTIARLMDR